MPLGMAAQRQRVSALGLGTLARDPANPLLMRRACFVHGWRFEVAALKLGDDAEQFTVTDFNAASEVGRDRGQDALRSRRLVNGAGADKIIHLIVGKADWFRRGRLLALNGARQVAGVTFPVSVSSTGTFALQ